MTLEPIDYIGLGIIAGACLTALSVLFWTHRRREEQPSTVRARAVVPKLHSEHDWVCKCGKCNAKV